MDISTLRIDPVDATLVCTPSFEVFLFRAGKLLTLAKPREGLIEFHSADLDLFQEIERSHPAFKGTLFVIEDGKFSGAA